MTAPKLTSVKNANGGSALRVDGKHVGLVYMMAEGWHYEFQLGWASSDRAYPSRGSAVEAARRRWNKLHDIGARFNV